LVRSRRGDQTNECEDAGCEGGDRYAQPLVPIQLDEQRVSYA